MSRPVSRFGPYLFEMSLDRPRVPSFDEYPFNLPAVRSLSTFAFHPKVTFFVGENGSGKSTILEAIAVAYGLNAEGGSRNLQFVTRDSHSQLYRYLKLSKQAILPADAYFLRAETFYNMSTALEQVGSPTLHNESHGEAFLSLFCDRFGSRGLYLLDEPEAALSPQRQLQFLVQLHDYCRQGCQFLIATHSPIILAYPDAAIHVFGENGLVETPYAQTEHFRITRNFLANPARSLKELFADDETAD